MGLELRNIQQIVDTDTGEVLMSSTCSKDVPDLPDEKSGFAAAFSELETAILETRKQTSTDIAEKYLEAKSKEKINEAIGLLDQEDGKTKIVSKQYLIESEFGTLQATAHRLIAAGVTVLDTSSELFVKIWIP